MKKKGVSPPSLRISGKFHAVDSQIRVALDLDGATGRVQRNAFDELPLVGGWGRRPLEVRAAILILGGS